MKILDIGTDTSEPTVLIIQLFGSSLIIVFPVYNQLIQVFYHNFCFPLNRSSDPVLKPPQADSSHEEP